MIMLLVHRRLAGWFVYLACGGTAQIVNGIGRTPAAACALRRLQRTFRLKAELQSILYALLNFQTYCRIGFQAALQGCSCSYYLFKCPLESSSGASIKYCISASCKHADVGYIVLQASLQNLAGMAASFCPASMEHTHMLALLLLHVL